MKTLKSITAAGLILLMSATAFAQDVIIGVPNWASVRGTAHILKVALEDNLGLKVELQNGTNPIVFEAMDSGAMHVHPEVWIPNQQNLFDTFVTEKGTVTFNPNAVLSEQQICVTKDTQERTGISALSDLSDPDMAANFDTDGDGRGEVWIGAAGWASTNVERIRAKSYGYAETMNLVEMDEAVALAQVDNAVRKGQDIVFFCYTPHHMFALWDLVPLSEPAHDPDTWNVTQPTDDPNWLEMSTASTAWDAAKLHIFYAKSLAETQPEAAEMLSKVRLTTDVVSQIVFAISAEKQDPTEFAKEWVAANSEMVDSWFN